METYSELPAIKLVWQKRVTEEDVRWAFNSVQAQLSGTKQAQYVIMDVSTNPKFPLKETTAAVLFGPYRHPNVVEWLVVGICEQWKFVERMLIKATNERKMRWFQTMEEVEEYISSRSVYNN